MRRRFNLSFFHVFLFVFIAGGMGYFIGSNSVNLAWKGYIPIANISQKNPPPAQNLNMGLFYEVLERVNREYYDKTKIKSQEVLYGAISGMLKSLDDPYTSFFPPKQNTDFKTQMAGEFSGIGAELGLNKDDRIMVISPLDSSPAEKSGIKAGDLILSVDGNDTVGWTLAKAVEKIRGPRGTDVKLAVLHEGAKEPNDITVNRDTIAIKSVRGEVKQYSCSGKTCKEGKDCSNCSTIAYIRLSQFGDKTNSEWIQVINNIFPQIKNSKNFKGIILDVRNNPGGYLEDAVFIASEFIKSGIVVSQINGDGEKTDISVSRTGVLLDQPLLVLVNKGSASASEIVSGALRDHKRARLVGETTFGKGTIQQAVDVDGGASVHISVGKWITPNGTWVHETGLKPDIEVKFDEELSKKTPDLDNQLQRAISELVK
jgi:carboxyl-terminal processing protease